MKFDELKDMLVVAESEDKFATEYKNERLNCQDVDSILFQRTPADNDRSEIQKLFNRLPRDIEGEPIYVLFYAFIAVGEKKDKNSKRSVMINVVDEFGNLMASHINEFAGIFKEYRGELVEFEARPGKYPKADKYTLYIDRESVRTVSTMKLRNLFSPWQRIGYPGKDINVQECINYYLTKSSIYQKEMLQKSEKMLDYISEKMFGVSGMLFPIILDMYLLRDNAIEYIDEIEKNLKHINIICTSVIDYIICLKPETYLDTFKLIAYIILNYLGLNLDNPNDMKYKTNLLKTIDGFDVKTEHAAYHIYNVLKDCGGSKALVEGIPEGYHTNPEQIVLLSRAWFANRILMDVPEETIKFLVKLNSIK